MKLVFGDLSSKDRMIKEAKQHAAFLKRVAGVQAIIRSWISLPSIPSSTMGISAPLRKYGLDAVVEGIRRETERRNTKA